MPQQPNESVGNPAKTESSYGTSVATRQTDLSLGVDERVRLMRDGVFNNASIVAGGVIGIILVPILLHGLGVESYGIWIVALSLVGVAGLFDCGLGQAVTREVAASLDRESTAESAKFVSTARNAYLLLGAAGGMVIAAAGLPMARGLHLPYGRNVAAVFLLAGAAFVAERLLTFSTAVLRGLRRFDASNALMIAMAIWRACGIIALLKLGRGLLTVMAWQALATAAAAWAGHWALRNLRREFRFGIGRPDWSILRAHLSFGLASQLTTVADVMLWQLVPVIVGFVLGSGWIAPFYIAQRFPLSLAPVIWSTAEALFPAVSQHQRDDDFTRTREILEVGTRWTVVIALPLCLVLILMAPELLQAWVGQHSPDTVVVLRLITLAVLVEGAAAASFQTLWGRGEVRSLVVISGALSGGSLALSLVLLPRLGVTGAAWGLLLPMLAASAAYTWTAARHCGTSLLHILDKASEGLLLPLLACLAVCTAVKNLGHPGWTVVITAASTAGLAYLICFGYSGARTEELLFFKNIATVPASLARSLGSRVRELTGSAGRRQQG